MNTRSEMKIYCQSSNWQLHGTNQSCIKQGEITIWPNKYNCSYYSTEYEQNMYSYCHAILLSS